jgi:phospholipid transport system transporter-binding protein
MRQTIKQANVMIRYEQGSAYVEGPLAFDTVMALLPQGFNLLMQHTCVTFDFSNVLQADSAGLALIMEWWRFAKKHAAEVRFANVPEALKALIAVTNLDQALHDVLV